MHDAYGARTVLSEYCGLNQPAVLSKVMIIWQHGWKTEKSNLDLDSIVGESGQTSDLADFFYFVARKEQEMLLRSFGLLNVETIGLPFAYAMKISDTPKVRQPNTLLIMPGNHAPPTFGGPNHQHEKEYISFISMHCSKFDEILVLFNCDDLQRGRQREWERAGFNYQVGGCESDPDSLRRLVRFFGTYSHMTTNGFGSHIAYASAMGCRVSVCGPGAPSPGNIKADTFLSNRPDLLSLEEKRQQEYQDLFMSLGMNCAPARANTHLDWGREQIGFDNVLSPENARSLIRRIYLEQFSTLDRLGLAPVKRSAHKFRSLLSLGTLSDGSQSIQKPWILARNLFHLFRPTNREEIRHLTFLQGGKPVFFRTKTTDIKSLEEYLVWRALDEVDLGRPLRILDLGSYGGYSLLYFASRFPSAEIVGVEPEPGNFALAQKNVGNRKGIHTIECAVWNRDEMVSILPGTDGEWESKIIKETANLAKVQGKTLFSILENLGWARVDLIKMDIEGAEYDILRESAPTLGKYCAVLIVEFHHRLARREERERIISLFSSGRYKASHKEIGPMDVFAFSLRNHARG